MYLFELIKAIKKTYKIAEPYRFVSSPKYTTIKNLVITCTYIKFALQYHAASI